MNLDKSDYAAIGLFLFMLGVTIHGYTNIEGEVAVHFDGQGSPDSTTDKLRGLATLPLISLGLFAFLKLIPVIDPLKDNIEEFEPALNSLGVFTIGFLSYIQTVVVVWNLGYRFNITKAVIPAIAVLFYALGLLFERAKRNWFVGLRTPWTLSDDEVWEKTHRKTAPLLKFSSVFVLGSIIYPEKLIWFVVAPAVAVSVFAILYSYKIYTEKED